jgi:hypothetical protein
VDHDRGLLLADAERLARPERERVPNPVRNVDARALGVVFERGDVGRVAHRSDRRSLAA